MTRDSAEQQLQVLAVGVHGALMTLHVLGAIYNARRKNTFDVAAHTAAALYDGWAMYRHIQSLNEFKDDPSCEQYSPV